MSRDPRHSSPLSSLPEPPPITTADDLLAVARRHGLALTAQDAAFDRSGLDFLVVHAHDQDGLAWIVRTPRRPEVFAASLVEARVLRLVRPHLPVAVPDWRLHARELIAYPRLDGTPAITTSEAGPTWHIDASALPGAFLDSFARALAAMQAITPEQAADAGVPTQRIEAVRAGLARSLAETRPVLRPSEVVWARWQRWLADDTLWPQHVALVHGDLHPGHLLLAADSSLIGILDWTEAQVSDPSIDLAMFHGCFGAAALAELLPRFESAGGTTWPGLARHAAERWAAFPALAAEWALRTDNAAVLEYARAQLATLTAESEADASA